MRESTAAADLLFHHHLMSSKKTTIVVKVNAVCARRNANSLHTRTREHDAGCLPLHLLYPSRCHSTRAGFSFTICNDEKQGRKFVVDTNQDEPLLPCGGRDIVGGSSSSPSLLGIKSGRFRKNFHSREKFARQLLVNFSAKRARVGVDNWKNAPLRRRWSR